VRGHDDVEQAVCHADARARAEVARHEQARSLARQRHKATQARLALDAFEPALRDEAGTQDEIDVDAERLKRRRERAIRQPRPRKQTVLVDAKRALRACAADALEAHHARDRAQPDKTAADLHALEREARPRRVLRR
jgi:hypothetical protein